MSSILNSHIAEEDLIRRFPQLEGEKIVFTREHGPLKRNAYVSEGTLGGFDSWYHVVRKIDPETGKLSATKFRIHYTDIEDSLVYA